MDNIDNKIAIVLRFLFFQGLSGWGAHPFPHLSSFAHVDSTASVTEHDFLPCSVVSHFLSHGPFILPSTLPSCPPRSDAHRHIPLNRSHPVLFVLFHPSTLLVSAVDA